MKGLKTGQISVIVNGLIEVSSGSVPSIDVDGKNIASYFTDAFDMKDGEYKTASFPGSVHITIENYKTNAKISDTMTCASSKDDADQGGTPDAM